MRTTVDLPGHIHQLARNLAHDRHQTLSQAIVELIERGLAQPNDAELSVSPVTGLTVINLGRTITSEDVRAAEDEEDEHIASFIRREARM